MGLSTKKQFDRCRGVTLAITLVILAYTLGCGRSADRAASGPGTAQVVNQSVSIGLPREPISSLTILAHARGFFTDEALEVTIVDTYPSGKRALAALLDGEVEVTSAADVPIVFNTFERRDFKITATIGTSDNEPRIVGRKDHGIERPADLSGKRIATQEASAVHYFLDTFLLKHGFSGEDVAVTYLAAEELPGALARGEIDAFCMREPFIAEAAAQLGQNATVFEEPGLYLKTCNLIAAASTVKEKPGVIRRILRALLRAEEYARSNPQEAIENVSARLGIPSTELARVWSQFDFRVTLDQSLLGYLEDEARWMMRIGLTQETDLPNYLHMMHTQSLREEQPDAVTIIE